MKKQTAKMRKMKFYLSGDKQGQFFTLGIILLLIPLIMLVSFYTTTSKTKSQDTTAKIRCDELHYFVEDVKRDLGRAVVIFGRRAAIYAIDYAVGSGTPLANYSFGCGPMCGVDCDKIVYPKNGSEAAIAELALCGTLNNTNVTYMVNHTVREWVRRIETRGEEKNFHVNLTLKEIKVIPMDAYHFSIIINSDVDIVDDTGICYYRGLSVSTMSNTSIVGLEDPLYQLSTQGHKFKTLTDCSLPLNFTKIANGTSGENISGGRAVLYSNMTPMSEAGIEAYCNATPAQDLKDSVLVMNSGGSVSCNIPAVRDCVNASSAKHFGALIANGSNNLTCAATIPWIRNTTKMNLSSGDCVLVKNAATDHGVYAGLECRNINYSCYDISNSSLYVGNCAKNYSDGPSFLDRLDGSYNLSERYKSQSLEYFNNPSIGLETLIDPSDLYDLEKYYGIIRYQNATSIDYLYWKNISGDRVCGICDGGLDVRLTCQHAKRYDLQTGC